MGNQYSITVSDESDRILQNAKDRGYKVSQIIDVALKTPGMAALARLHTNDRALTRYFEGKKYGDDDQ